MRILTTALLAATLAGPASADVYRVLALRVDFPFENPDHETTTGRGTFDLGSYADDPEIRARYVHPWDIPPHNRNYFENHLASLADYWSRVSEGRVNIEYEVWPREPDAAYTMSNTFYKYGNGRSDAETNRKLVALTNEAVTTAEAVEGDALDFSAFDTIIIFRAGGARETYGNLNDIPAAYLPPEDFVTYGDGPVSADGVPVDHAIIMPEYISTTGLGGLNGLIVQMFGFRLGLPSQSNNIEGLPAAGGWTMMDVGAMAFGYGTIGFVPTHPGIWSKIDLGWIEPVTVTTDTVLDIAATHIAGDLPRAIKVPLSDTEYFLVENRFQYAPSDSLPSGIVFSGPDSTGVWLTMDHYDAYIPGSGLLVWRINDQIIDEHRADNSINNDSARRGIDLLEADGRQDIGALFGFGDPRTQYAVGYEGDTLKADGTDTLSPQTNPSTDSMWGGSSAITIQALTPPGEVMRVRITVTATLPGFPVTVSGAEQVTAADLDDDGADEFLVTLPDSVTVIRQTGAPAAEPPQLFNSTHDFPVPDGIGIISYAAADDYIAVLGYNDLHDYVLCLGSTGATILTPYPVPAESAAGPILADLDRDGTYEAVIAADREVIFYQPDGSFDRAFLSEDPIGAPIAADLDDDGYPEVIQCTRTHVFAFRAGGIIADGFPYRLPVGDRNETITSPPAAADLDGDSRIDIACATSDRRMVAWSPDGIMADGFPFTVLGEVVATPCVFRTGTGGGIGIAYLTTDERLTARDIGVTAASDDLPWPMWRGGPDMAAALLSDDIVNEPAGTAPFEAFCYPNPVTGDRATFRIVPEGPTGCTVTLYTVDGREVFRDTISEQNVIPGAPNEIVMPAGNLASGLYIARIETRQRTMLYKVGVLK